MTFEVKATGTGLIYQWQWSNDNGRIWRNSSSRSSVCNVVCQESFNGMMYKCIVTDTNGNTLTSEPAKLTITAELDITDIVE